MKYFLALTITALSIHANAAFKIKPGLWEVETKSPNGGLGTDMSAKMQQAMKNMSPAQKLEMEKMMGQHGMGFGDKGMKVCHTDKTMSVEALVQDKKSNCTILNKQELSDGIKFDIKCDKGTGTAEYHAKDDSSYTGFNEFVTARGKNRIEFIGKFLSANCGNIKPLNEVSLPKAPKTK